MSNFKKIVEERMRRTGESWATAQARVRARVAKPSANAPSGRAWHEVNCPLSYEPAGPGVQCECLGIDTSLLVGDGDDSHDA